MTGAAITGVGSALPRTERSSAALEDELGLPPGWIVERTGIRARRVAAADESACSLGTAAARVALERAGLEPSDVDLTIVATVTPDYRLPSTACLINTALGADGSAFDLNASCTGFLCSLAQADAMVRSGAAMNVLLVGVDLMSRITSGSDPKTAVLFGDGAGAAVVTAVEGAGRLGPFAFHSDGRQPELLMAASGSGEVVMAGREVYRRAVQAMVSSVLEVLSPAELPELRLLVAHQANGRILAAVASRLDLPEDRVFSNLSKVGNTSAASIPIALDEAERSGRMSEGDLIALTAFGAGFVWGSGLVRWGSHVRPAASELAGAAHG